MSTWWVITYSMLTILDFHRLHNRGHVSVDTLRVGESSTGGVIYIYGRTPFQMVRFTLVMCYVLWSKLGCTSDDSDTGERFSQVLIGSGIWQTDHS